jgi:hypothetical protein
MTTIILTIIGILLAAAAALMVIFYGGDAFNGGSIGAQANTYQNAGTNVISAVQLAKADAFAYTTLASLHSDTNPDADYLKELPTLPNSSGMALSGKVFSVTVGGDQAAKVCARINKNLKLTADGTGVTQSTTVKMGCDNTTKVFFANA